MQAFEKFTFNYPVHYIDVKGHRQLIDIVSVQATAFFYKFCGTVRSVDIDTVHDQAGQDVTKWIPFLTYDSIANAGDWLKELEMAAKSEAERKFETALKN